MKENAEKINNFEFEIYFNVYENYLYGRNENHSEKLVIPFENKITNSNLVYDNIELLIKYYEDVISTAKKYNQSAEKFYFRINPYILDKDTNKILVGFPWYSTFEECKHLFSQLKQNKEGNIFYDIDQGWEVSIDNFTDNFSILEGDPDENITYCNIILDRKEVLKQIDFVEKRTEEIIQKLVAHFKTDYWSKY